ncbi:MAG: cyclic peptide export ABC transporter, partial [Polyangiales bacterium]
MSVLGSLASSSRRQVTVALVMSALAGLLGAALVALINQALSAERAELPKLGVIFGVVAVAMGGCRWISQAQFVELSQASLARLRTQVSRRLV